MQKAIFSEFLQAKRPFSSLLFRPVPAAPLAVFRMLFGGVMLVSLLRFWSNGWIGVQYLASQVQFKYFGFEWVQMPAGEGIYLLFGLAALGAFGVMLGLLYRFSAAVFFLSFTYIELIDKTWYLNHYYFVSLVALLLVFLPAGRYWSVDTLLWPGLKRQTVPAWARGILLFQIALVYVFAGLAKINSDWLLAAQPMHIWLPANSYLPLIGPLLAYKTTAYVFSWAGMLYDISVVFFLLWRPTRWVAYAAVIVFHLLTGLLFQIGVFPVVMILATLLFFSPAFHQNLLEHLALLRRSNLSFLLVTAFLVGIYFWIGGATWPFLLLSTGLLSGVTPIYSLLQRAIRQGFRTPRFSKPFPVVARPVTVGLLSLFVAWQVLWPLRSAFYPGELFWHEQGYRFSWRVMLMEKAGYATFYVRDPATGRSAVADYTGLLLPHQEKQMAFQPDMLLQMAHFLEERYRRRGIADPEIRAEVYVRLQDQPSRLFIDPSVDLTRHTDGFHPKTWVLRRNDPRALAKAKTALRWVARPNGRPPEDSELANHSVNALPK